MLKRGDLGTLEQICQKERFNHTLVIVPKRTVFEPELPLNQGGLSSNGAESKAAQS